MIHDDPAVRWLLQSKDASVRYFTRVDLLGQSARSRDVKEQRNRIPDGPRVRKLFAGQRADGGFGVHPYQKWNGAHWRLVSLVELGVTDDPRARAATSLVLQWLTGHGHRNSIRCIRGRYRAHASMEGNALAACSRLGLARDPRVQQLAESLLTWQWEDGGWNCDPTPKADHSSFYESLAPLWGLTEYHRVTRDTDCRRAAERAAEFFLMHRLFRSDRTGRVINSNWLKLHYPLYWHYDILQALVILSRLGKLNDPRAQEALDVIENKRLPDGCWRPGGYYWFSSGRKYRVGGKDIASNREAVDWGRGGPNEMITLNALRALKSAGRYG